MRAYRAGQEDQLGALGLVLNAAVLWTIRYLDAAVAELRALPADQREHQVLDEDVARLSSLRHANLNVLGRYSFRGSTPAGGVLRPLRDPAAASASAGLWAGSRASSSGVQQVVVPQQASGALSALFSPRW
ncbi:Tn3 family transposase [Nonomuraea sp. NPDC003201]